MAGFYVAGHAWDHGRGMRDAACTYVVVVVVVVVVYLHEKDEVALATRAPMKARLCKDNYTKRHDHSKTNK